MEPLYFGHDESLFGFYHPAGVGPGGGAVLLNPPLFNDYYRTYQINKELANVLSGAGYDVLRFDLSGMGDSAKRLKEVDFVQWQVDVSAAFTEICDLSGYDTAAVVGIRCSALLAMSSLESANVDGLVFWDPVASGADYLQLLQEIERSVAEGYFDSYQRTVTRGPNELVGYEIHPDLRNDLSRLDFETLHKKMASHPQVIVVQSAGQPMMPGNPDVTNIGIECEWNNSGGPMMFARPIIDALVAAVSRVLS